MKLRLLVPFALVVSLSVVALAGCQASSPAPAASSAASGSTTTAGAPGEL